MNNKIYLFELYEVQKEMLFILMNTGRAIARCNRSDICLFQENLSHLMSYNQFHIRNTK